jgi:hypothetical protein
MRLAGLAHNQARRAPTTPGSAGNLARRHTQRAQPDIQTASLATMARLARTSRTSSTPRQQHKFSAAVRVPAASATGIRPQRCGDGAGRQNSMSLAMGAAPAGIAG